jgi:hypothetical protein
VRAHWAGGLAVLLIAAAVVWLTARNGDQAERRPRTVAAAGIALRVPNGWTGRASLFDQQSRTPHVEIRDGDRVRITIDELGNRPGHGRFRTIDLPIALRPGDLLEAATGLPRERALVGRLFATRGRSFTLQAEVPRDDLPTNLREVNDVIATLRIRRRPGTDPATLARLNRPLDLPPASRTRCPRSKTGRRAPGVAHTLGDGPAFPVLTSPSGVANLDPVTRRHGWYLHKTLWAVSPRYRGPLLIRGGRIDSRGDVRFSVRFELRPMLRLPGDWPGTTDWRYVPNATALRGPGCYALQIDGLDFSRDVVFEARL